MADSVTVNILFDIRRLPEDKGGCGMDEISAKAGTMLTFNPYRTDRHKNWAFVQMVYLSPPSAFLANSSYGNEYGHQGNNNTDYWKATSPNTTGLDSAFLNCLNMTIAAAIPIIDPTFFVKAPKDKLSSGQIAGIAVGSVVGALLLE
ncbi:SubName: Full=Uncharacterized protein {ECO:0000313/EMBL:CCA68117.1} [Serendipita indica DSM 11827]|nr:SubName: Full=Uncharacterized protein {ECO:0000313/EMBL:CCA68117.1} [Serendipita indica DSM 11827]